MKRTKRILALAMAMLVLLLPLALAEEDADSQGAIRVEIQDVSVDELGNVDLLFYTDATDGSVGVNIDGIPVTMESLDRYDSGRSWLFLVDTASVSTLTGKEPIRATLTNLISLVGDGDNAGILATGMTADQIQFQDKESLTAMIESEALKLDSSKNNLAETVEAAIGFLDGSADAHAHKVLVVISNGETLAPEGSSDEVAVRVATMVQDSKVALYTVAYTKKNPAEDEPLAVFAMLPLFSRGGVPLISTGGEKGAKGCVASIVLNEALFFKLHCTPAVNGANGTTLTLTINDSSASCPLSAEDQLKIQAAIDATTPSKEPVKLLDLPAPIKEETDWTLYIVLGACGVALIAVIVLLIVLLRKRKKPAGGGPVTREVSTGYAPSAAGGPPTIPGGAPKQEVQVTLTALNGAKDCFATFDGGELILGRDPSRAKMLLEDPKISGVHLKLRYQGGALVAEDVSRNGTEVNGRRITAPTVLRQRDVLTMGLSQYQITWWAK